jgi:hypothetical protein
MRQLHVDVQTKEVCMSKLEQLAEAAGYEDVAQLIEDMATEDLVEGICLTVDCWYTALVAPPETKGYCPLCESTTIASCLVLAGAI